MVAGAAMAVALAGAERVEAARSQDTPAAARPLDVRARAGVRTENTVLATLIREASERSETFRGLTDTIDASDGVVYVSEGTCGHGVRACLLLTVTVAGPHRILWVLVDPRKADWDLMGSIGHELRHAIEVLSDRKVTSNPAMLRFFRNEGRVENGTFETRAAIKAGDAVRAEVRKRASR